MTQRYFLGNDINFLDIMSLVLSFVNGLNWEINEYSLVRKKTRIYHIQKFIKVDLTKEVKIVYMLFLVIAMYCQASSSQIKSITQPLPLLAGCEGSLSKCR